MTLNRSYFFAIDEKISFTRSDERGQPLFSGHVKFLSQIAFERLNREIRRRTRVVGTFPDGKSALMLVTARLKHVAESEWGSRRCLDVSMLKEVEA